MADSNFNEHSKITIERVKEFSNFLSDHGYDGFRIIRGEGKYYMKLYARDGSSRKMKHSSSVRGAIENAVVEILEEENDW